MNKVQLDEVSLGDVVCIDSVSGILLQKDKAPTSWAARLQSISGDRVITVCGQGVPPKVALIASADPNIASAVNAIALSHKGSIAVDLTHRIQHELVMLAELIQSDCGVLIPTRVTDDLIVEAIQLFSESVRGSCLKHISSPLVDTNIHRVGCSCKHHPTEGEAPKRG